MILEMGKLTATAWAATVLFLTACGQQAAPATPTSIQQPVSRTAITVSSVFADQSPIPVEYTCSGKNTSPTLSWGGLPQATQTLALVVDDPDAPGGTFTHWVLFNLPSGVRQLDAAVPRDERMANGALQGKNDSGRTGYDGPCPPAGKVHHYRFHLYALDAPLKLEAGATKAAAVAAMQGHILAEGELVGTYQR